MGREHTSPDFGSTPNFHCPFHPAEAPIKSWNDCYKCWYVILDDELRKDICERHGLDYRIEHHPKINTPCDPLVRSGMFVQFGTYAAPIAWWLNFFTPDQFVFLNSDELKWVSWKGAGACACLLEPLQHLTIWNPAGFNAK